MAPVSKSRNLLQLLLIFAVIYLGSQFLLETLFPEQFGRDKGERAAVELTATDDSFTIGHHPVLSVINRTEKELMLPARCPRPPVDLFRVEGESTNAVTPIDSTEVTLACREITRVPAGETATLDLAPWKYSLFERVGTYEARLPLDAGQMIAEGTQTGSGDVVAAAKVELTTRFTIREPGPITKLFRTLVTSPLLNLLIFIASIIPGHDLGLAIIILTLIVKMILFWPTQKAMEGQKKMQLLQPKLEELKRKYGSDSAKIHEETMRLWKEHKINPLSSCLPMLLQFPILIGLFYVIRDGSVLAVSHHLIYPFYQHLPWMFDTQFLGLDLLKPNIYVMPFLLVVMQFLQMKLSFAIVKRKKAKSEVIDVGEKDNTDSSPQEMQQKIMLYGLPLLIGFFAFQFPAAVSLYWGVSTLFAIGQQLIVNREHIRP